MIIKALLIEYNTYHYVYDLSIFSISLLTKISAIQSYTTQLLSLIEASYHYSGH